ncbi:uncharacterized protein [Amphiura filiformis]|uniref:uncharacterized protein n=1 Tax=Amphiura filiformis TaxID=82378 RepID=UPI003B218053
MAAGQWDSYIKSNISKYRHKDTTQKDVSLVFKMFRDLRPKMDSYTFNDGSRRELLCIEGTIPVYYKGNTYNIPVVIWLMDTHPDNPPLCFVKPTPDMLIKPSKYVDANGRIYLPYLKDWQYPSSDLIGLIQVMSAVFGENSPLFARGSQPRPSPMPGKNMPMPQPTPGFSELPLAQQDNGSLNETALLQTEVTDLRSRLRAMELKFEDPTECGADNGSDGDVCQICHNPNQVKFQCGHGACKRCGELLKKCPMCKTPIMQLSSLNAAPKSPDGPNTLRKVENSDAIYDAMSNEDKDFVMKIVALGFSKSQTARTVKRHGRNVRLVVEFLSALDAICSEGFSEDRAEEALQLHDNDQKSAHDFLKLWSHFEQFGFKENDIKRELIVHGNAEEKVLAALTKGK